MPESEVRSKTSSYCFRCTNGCIHVVSGNTTLTLSQVDFLALAEAIDCMRVELKELARESFAECAGADVVM